LVDWKNKITNTIIISVGLAMNDETAKVKMLHDALTKFSRPQPYAIGANYL